MPRGAKTFVFVPFVFAALVVHLIERRQRLVFSVLWCLNVHWCDSLDDARHKIDAFRWDYSEHRPHRSLKGLSTSGIRRRTHSRWTSCLSRHTGQMRPGHRDGMSRVLLKSSSTLFTILGRAGTGIDPIRWTRSERWIDEGKTIGVWLGRCRKARPV